MSSIADQLEIMGIMEDAVRKANRDLREARRELRDMILNTMPAAQAIDMGILSINVGTLRRHVRMGHI